MKATTTEDRSRLNPARTVAMATAFSVHIAAMLFLLAPTRPQAQAQLEARDFTEVQFIPPPIKPPPPPKPAPPPPERNPPPIRPRQPVPPVIERPVTMTTTTTVAEDPNIISDVPDSEPVIPPGPATDSFVDARADAQYGSNRRVPYPRTALRKREQGEEIGRAHV